MEDKYSSLNEDGAVFDSVEAEEEILEDDEEDYEDIYSEYDLQYYLNPSIYPDSFLFERNSLLALGGLTGSYDYGSMITLLNNSPEIDYKVLSRGEENIFIPSITVGINAKGKNKEQAKEIIKSLITSKSNEIYSNY